MNLLLRSLFSPSGPRLPRSTVSSVAIRTKALARHRQVAIAAQVIVGRGPPKRKRKFHMCNTLVQKRNIIEEPLSRQTRQHSILAKWIRWSRSAPACSSLIVADSRSHFPNLHRFTLFRYCKPSRSCYGDRHGHGDANSTRLLLLRHRPPLVSLCYCVAVAPAALARLPAAPCLLRASARCVFAADALRDCRSSRLPHSTTGHAK